MSTSLFFECDRPEQIPDVAGVRELVSRDRHLVLVLRAVHEQPDLSALIGSLIARLPEDYSVFDAGPLKDGASRVTVRQVLSRAEITAHADEIVEAGRDFRRTARSLITRLAEKLEVPLEVFWTGLLRTQVRQTGVLDREWRYFFHGLECGFESRCTGQKLDVVLFYPDEFGVLDPYFFAEFAQSSPWHRTVGELFQDRFHDAARAWTCWRSSVVCSAWSDTGRGGYLA